MSQTKNSTAPSEAQPLEPLVTAFTEFHAPFTAMDKKIFAVQDGVNASAALVQANCLLETAMNVLELVDPTTGSAWDFVRAVEAARCILEPARRIVMSVQASMVGTHHDSSVPGGEA